MSENRTIKSLRVKQLLKDDFFSTGITRKKYYKVFENDTYLRAWLIDDHSVPYPCRSKTLYDRKFVKRFTPLKTKIKCH